MRAWIVGAGAAGLFTAGAVACLVAALANMREMRRRYRTPPLAVAEIRQAVPRPIATPRRWPALDCSEPEVLSAYRDYALELRQHRAWTGELIALIGGAALGTSLSQWDMSPGRITAMAGSLVVCLVGLACRDRADRHFGLLADRYERRRKQCLAEVAAAAPAERLDPASTGSVPSRQRAPTPRSRKEQRRG